MSMRPSTWSFDRRWPMTPRRMAAICEEKKNINSSSRHPFKDGVRRHSRCHILNELKEEKANSNSIVSYSSCARFKMLHGSHQWCCSKKKKKREPHHKRTVCWFSLSSRKPFTIFSLKGTSYKEMSRIDRNWIHLQLLNLSHPCVYRSSILS